MAENQETFPAKVVVILKIKKPYQKEPFYLSYPSPLDASMSSEEQVKKFIAEVVSEYNNRFAEMIETEYDEPTTVYKILSISIRFIYPLTSI